MLQKILCLGTNNEITDQYVSELAELNKSKNHGLIVDELFTADSAGYYHTTILDISFGGIIRLAYQFDKVIMLDQPQSVWSHWKPMLSTYKLCQQLEELGIDTEYKNNQNIKNFLKFSKLVENNPSFCIYPWIELLEENNNCYTCARSSYKIKAYTDLKDWKNDPDYNYIRQKMLAGEKLPEICNYCYDYEDRGIESYRQFETKEWISKLNIQSVQDLDDITHPFYYEIRLKNTCNLKCRGCRPEFSNMIDKEYKTHGIVFPGEQGWHFSSTDIIDIETLNPQVRIYLTGGEPTVIPEVYDFMEKCIAAGKTDFDLTIGTNGQHITERWLKLCDYFSNMNFSFSLDGYGKINDYWRTGSDWNTIVKNMHILQEKGHTISINTVPGIYNVTNLHLLFEWLDQEFPQTSVYLQINHNGIHSAYNHPRANLVIKSMERCRQTKMYYSDGKSNKTCIDSIYKYYSELPSCNIEDLSGFFAYNDQLDKARNMYLKDYIPELEQCRSLIK